MDTVANNFMERFRKIKSDRQLTEREMSKQLEMAQQHINYLLNGERKPSLDTLVKIAKTYNVSVDWLLGIDHITTVDEYHQAEAELERLKGEYVALLERLITTTDADTSAEMLKEVQRIKDRTVAIQEMLGEAKRYPLRLRSNTAEPVFKPLPALDCDSAAYVEVGTQLPVAKSLALYKYGLSGAPQLYRIGSQYFVNDTVPPAVQAVGRVTAVLHLVSTSDAD